MLNPKAGVTIVVGLYRELLRGMIPWVKRDDELVHAAYDRGESGNAEHKSFDDMS